MWDGEILKQSKVVATSCNQNPFHQNPFGGVGTVGVAFGLHAEKAVRSAVTLAGFTVGLGAGGAVGGSSGLEFAFGAGVNFEKAFITVVGIGGRVKEDARLFE